MEQTERLEELFCGLHEQEFSCSSYVCGSFFDDLENLDEAIHRMGSEMLSRGNTWSPENDFVFYDLMNENHHPSPLTTVESDQQSPTISTKNSSAEFPLSDMEAHDQSTLLSHLFKAYGEAKTNQEKDLTDILVNSINGKSDLMGSTALQRIAHHLFRKYRDGGGDEYLRLRQELGKNYLQALKVIYESLVDSRLAHFTANSAILESLPPTQDTTLHIVDFDLGEGIQWPPLIEAFSFRNRVKPSLLKITSIAQEAEEGSSCPFSFEETKQSLLSHARELGVNLLIEEKTLEDFAAQKQKGGEWLAFNCMVGLPHMGRKRSKRSVMEFLILAKQSLIGSPGILTMGEGETWDSYSEQCCYASYLDHLLRHYQALFESLANNFPGQLIEARTTLEILFLAPLISTIDDWYKDWADGCYGFEIETLFEGRRLSQESIAEAEEMVSVRGHHTYEVKVRDHEIALRWNGVPLVKVSSWM